MNRNSGQIDSYENLDQHKKEKTFIYVHLLRLHNKNYHLLRKPRPI
uniref:Uncharacterized protein n=1 Tax=Arundo donax TaxID=35708 RepID=A0A0A9HUY5_ARUDO